MRHTKIVATLGPASDSDAVLDDLVEAGVDVVRLNFSHGTHETHRAAFERVRAAAARAGRHVAVLQDLGGPKIRTGSLAGGEAVVVRPGDALRLATGEGPGDATRIHTSFAGLAASVRPGDRLLIDDGHVELRVDATDGREMLTTVVFGGPIGEHKGINAPGVTLPASALTPKDADDLRFGLALGVDLVALSFVQTPDDLRAARAVMVEGGRPDVPLVAKIERPQAVDRLDGILQACDGVMIARGDLGLEVPLERVPRVQKQVTEAARCAGLPVIVATQVLDSMRTEPRPTRAEVSDAAHAVDDGVDAIMLAGETAVGVAPARVVRTLAAIVDDAEAAAAGAPAVRLACHADATSVEAICEAAITLAERGHAEAIVAVTRTGRTARILAALRPSTPVFALTERAEIARRLALCRGVVPVVVALGSGHLPLLALTDRLREARVLAERATVVIVSVDPDLTRADTNFLKLLTLAC
jgi:pyruvate kinase